MEQYLSYQFTALNPVNSARRHTKPLKRYKSECTNICHINLQN